MVVMRALAKDPSERYQSAEEMDADLRRINRGVAISPVTEEAATAIISRPPADVTAITSHAPRPPAPYAPPAAYYDYDEPPRRAIWPWIVALLFVTAALVGGYFLYSQLQDQLSGSKTVAVGNYLGLREIAAVKLISDAGLRANPVRQPNADPQYPETYVFSQTPRPGDRIQKNNFVTIYVSTGPPKTAVPSVVGEQIDRALSDLQDAKLKGHPAQVESDKPQGQVISQSPKAGASVAEGTSIRLNVSKGPTPVAVPNVVGSTYDTASSILQAKGFAVRRTDVKSDQPKDTVIGMTPTAGTLQPPGAVINLTVSKGPTTSTVPDVTTLSQNDAQAQLKASGFGVHIVTQPVTDPSQDGIVQTQDPPGGTQAAPGKVVTIAVGKFGAPTTPGPP